MFSEPSKFPPMKDLRAFEYAHELATQVHEFPTGKTNLVYDMGLGSDGEKRQKKMQFFTGDVLNHDVIKEYGVYPIINPRPTYFCVQPIMSSLKNLDPVPVGLMYCLITKNLNKYYLCVMADENGRVVYPKLEQISE